MSEIADRGYTQADALVSTAWVAEHLSDPGFRFVESNEDPLVYPSGHLPGAVEIDWVKDLNDPLRRDYLDRAGFEALCRRLGLERETTVVFYGDRNNWWACYAYWVFHLFGHHNARIMDGGRLKWQKEGRTLVRDNATLSPSNYQASERDDHAIRAFRDEVLAHVRAGLPLVDVRSPEEFRGERLHMPDYPNEGALRGGHIPGAKSVPWGKTVRVDDGTFKTAAELRELYEQEQGLKPTDDVVVYCRIGERSSHSWFVLTRLLGYSKVRNYDGSWTEWGNMVGVPIERP